MTSTSLSRAAIAVALGLAFATGAAAQTTTGTATARAATGSAATGHGLNLVEVNSETMISPLNMKAEALADRDVYDTAGNAIGEIETIFGTDARTPTAASISFDTGGLFSDDKERIVDLSDLSLNGDRMVLGLDKEKILALPANE